MGWEEMVSRLTALEAKIALMEGDTQRAQAGAPEGTTPDDLPPARIEASARAIARAAGFDYDALLEESVFVPGEGITWGKNRFRRYAVAGLEADDQGARPHDHLRG